MAKTVSSEWNLALVIPEVACQWHPSQNGNQTPYTVAPYSHKKVWWKCPKGHEWRASIINRANGSGCPFCNGRRPTSDNNLLAIKPSLVSEWHSTKNGELTPDKVTSKSERKVWWHCSKGHEWTASIKSRVYGTGCPYCSGRRATKDNNLAVVNPLLAAEWHPIKNGHLTPNDVTPKSSKKVWWKCAKHEWQASVDCRARGTGCPYCNGSRPCVENNLATANPVLACEWHSIKNKNLTPNMVTPNSHKKVWWQCSKGHEWQTTVNNRSFGSRCPYCSKRISAIGGKWLDELNIPIREHVVKISRKLLYFDGFDPKTNTVYEFLGDYWHGNPNIHHPHDINPSTKQTFGSLLYHTVKRLNAISKAGFDIICRWERGNKDFKYEPLVVREKDLLCVATEIAEGLYTCNNILECEVLRENQDNIG